MIIFISFQAITICITKTVEIFSPQSLEDLSRITMVNKITKIDDTILVPWLIGNEWKKVGNMECKYMFGHFELPNFFMNAMVEMPRHRRIKTKRL